MAVYERLLGELDANSQHLSEQISEIDLTDPQDARVLMPEQGTDILGHFGDDRFLERYQRYKAHIAEWRQQYPKLAAVDLRYDSQVVLEMTPGTNAVAAAIGDSASAADPDKKPVAGAPKPSAGTANTDSSSAGSATSAASKPDPAVNEAAATNAPAAAAEQAQGKQASAGQAAAVRPKKATQKPVSVEALAAKQRATRARAAKLKAAHERAQREKKRASTQRTALNTRKGSSSTHAATVAAQGQ
jgi:cell division protein FtsQ